MSDPLLDNIILGNFNLDVLHYWIIDIVNLVSHASLLLSYTILHR